MKLHYSPLSPYARKVLVLAHETGLAAKLELLSAVVSPIKPNLEYARDNPLMKVPSLVTDGGEALYDSRVICEYLDSLHGGRKLFPPEGGARWRALRQAALADGIVDAAILCRYEETTRPVEKRSSEWVEGQALKVRHGLDALEAEVETLSSPLDIGQIAIACALGYLEFRKPVGENRPGRPRLFKWYDAFAQRPSMQASAPKS